MGLLNCPEVEGETENALREHTDVRREGTLEVIQSGSMARIETGKHRTTATVAQGVSPVCQKYHSRFP